MDAPVLVRFLCGYGAASLAHLNLVKTKPSGAQNRGSHGATPNTHRTVTRALEALKQDVSDIRQAETEKPGHELYSNAMCKILAGEEDSSVGTLGRRWRAVVRKATHFWCQRSTHLTDFCLWPVHDIEFLHVAEGFCQSHATLLTKNFVMRWSSMFFMQRRWSVISWICGAAFVFFVQCENQKAGLRHEAMWARAPLLHGINMRRSDSVGSFDSGNRSANKFSMVVSSVTQFERKVKEMTNPETRKGLHFNQNSPKRSMKRKHLSGSMVRSRAIMWQGVACKTYGVTRRWGSHVFTFFGRPLWSSYSFVSDGEQTAFLVSFSACPFFLLQHSEEEREVQYLGDGVASERDPPVVIRHPTGKANVNICAVWVVDCKSFHSVPLALLFPQ